jgi:hypothetical protein
LVLTGKAGEEEKETEMKLFKAAEHYKQSQHSTWNFRPKFRFRMRTLTLSKFASGYIPAILKN